MRTQLAGLALAVIALTGCSAAPTAEVAETATSAESGEATPVGPTSGYPNANPNPDLGTSDLDEFLLRSAKATWNGTLPSDTELLDAAYSVCDQLASGAAKDDIHVFSGSDDAEDNNKQMIVNATNIFCFQFFD